MPQVGGRLLTGGATAGFDPLEDIRFIRRSSWKVLGSNAWARDDIEALLQLVQQNRLKVLIDKVYPLVNVREALRSLEDRNVGKVVVTQ